MRLRQPVHGALDRGHDVSDHDGPSRELTQGAVDDAEDKTRDKLRLIVERGLIGGPALGADEEERLRRSGLIATQLIGFALLRCVWKMEPIASMPEDEVVAAMAPNLQRYVHGDIS